MYAKFQPIMRIGYEVQTLRSTLKYRKKEILHNDRVRNSALTFAAHTANINSLSR